MKREEREYIAFTQEMKKEYTILIPTMLPMHFELVASVLHTYGYKAELLRSEGQALAETGLRYVHNDTCYPAILVVGQFLDALASGKYDPHKTALILFQTGGGCRASNYIPLLRKALAKAGYGYVPVISMNFLGMEHHPGFRMTLSLMSGLLFAVFCGDLLLTLVNQSKPYEAAPGSAQALADEWTERMGRALGAGSRLRIRQLRRACREILRDFAALPRRERSEAVRVGVVGEIFVKYSPLGNNALEQFLVDEGAEVVMPGLLDFFMFCVYNGIVDYKLYGRKPFTGLGNSLAFRLLNRMKRDMIRLLQKEGSFTPPTDFRRTLALCGGTIGLGAKMGEGWLLTAEMLELADAGVKNIVCVQPFGCLPNHVCGKGMMRPVKQRVPDINIVAVDYDAGASGVNQENRLKLMLANARGREPARV